jgi:rod shape-determining protein MreC
MQRLVQLLLKYRAFLVFGLMELFCFWMIVNFNSFQSSAYFTSSNSVAGNVADITSTMSSYFSLGDANDELAEKNASLQSENDQLKEAIDQYHELAIKNELLQRELILIKDDTLETLQSFKIRLHEAKNYLPARVIKNSTISRNNYLTLNKGRQDGIEINMGVVSNSGIVGRVVSVSANFCLVKSLLSKNYKVSIQFTKQKTYGSLVWNNNNEEFVGKLETIPRHLETFIGDTIVTSGYNAVFPEGIMVGTVKNASISDHQTWYDITIDLTTDFKSLYYVYVVRDPNNPERKELEFKHTK